MTVRQIVLVTAVALFAAASYAQSCAEQVFIIPQHCSSPKLGCTGSYPVTSAFPCKDFSRCFTLSTGSTSCCGIPHEFDVAGDNCVFTEFKDPAKRDELLTLARTTNVLVRTCQGVFMPAKLVLQNL